MFLTYYHAMLQCLSAVPSSYTKMRRTWNAKSEVWRFFPKFSWKDLTKWVGGGGCGRGEAETQCFLLRFNHTSRKQSLLKTVYSFDTNPPPLRFFFVGNFSFLRIQNNPQNQKNVKLEHDGLVCKQRSQNSPCVALDRKNGCLNFSPL